MTLLIIIGAGLLVYGFWREFDSATAPEETAAPVITIPAEAAFQYPAGLTFYQLATTADGGVVLVFEDSAAEIAGGYVAIRLDAAGNEIARLNLSRAPE